MKAAVFERLATHVASYWVNFLKKRGPLPPWMVRYESHARKVHARWWGNEGGLTGDGELDDSAESGSDGKDDEQ